MRKRIQEFKETVHGFIDQSDDVLLVVGAHDTDMALVHKILESVDLEQPADIVLRFAHPAADPVVYVNAIMTSVQAQMDAANMVREQEALPPWPPLPPVCGSEQVLPGPRIKAAMQHIRGLFPLDEDHRIVWCLLPTEVRDPAGYASVLGSLLPKQGPEPWMNSQRILIRDRTDVPFIIPTLRALQIENTLLYAVDFSTEAMLDGLAAEARDPDTPEIQRMQVLLQLAAVDYGHKRHADAIDKYRIAYNYFRSHEQAVFAGLCLGGVGDVLLAQGDAAGALQRYQQGLALSAPQGVPGLPVTMQLCARAGDAAMRLKSFGEAEGYYDNASQIAGKLVNLEYKCDMMEKVGLARWGKRDIGGAVQIWKLGIERCKDGHYLMRWKSILDHMAVLYGENHQVAEQREAQRDALGVQTLMDQGAKA